jgi:hypothetical protein
LITANRHENVRLVSRECKDSLKPVLASPSKHRL